MSTSGRVGAALILVAVLGGCAPMTPEQQAAWEESQRRAAAECQQRGGAFVSGACVSRGGGT
jgi:hypothetical protein